MNFASFSSAGFSVKLRTDEPYLGAFSDLRRSHTKMGLVLYEEDGICFYPQLDPMFLKAAVQKADAEGYPGP